MKLKVKFEEGERHCWLRTDESNELFIQKKPEDVEETDGVLTCWIDVEHMDEIRGDSVTDADYKEPDSVFLCCAGPEETKLYSVEEAVTYAGGDCLLFLKPMATFH